MSTVNSKVLVDETPVTTYHEETHEKTVAGRQSAKDFIKELRKHKSFTPKFLRKLIIKEFFLEGIVELKTELNYQTDIAIRAFQNKRTKGTEEFVSALLYVLSDLKKEEIEALIKEQEEEEKRSNNQGQVAETKLGTEAAQKVA